MNDFQHVLQQVETAGRDKYRLTVRDVRAQLGSDAFGPALLLLGVVALSPIGAIPGAPTVMSAFIVLIAGQLAVGRDHFWLPRFLLNRSVNTDTLGKVVRFVRPVARILGKVFWARLAFLTQGPFARAIGAACTALALTLPPLEVVPFGATVPSSSITVFALALVARDGLLACLALLLSGWGVYLLATTL